MAVTRPRGAKVNPERRQKPLHPTHKTAQEKMLTDGTFDKKVPEKKQEVVEADKPQAQTPTPAPAPQAATPTPVPSTPPNNLTSNVDQSAPADGTKVANPPAVPGRTDVLPLPKG